MALTRTFAQIKQSIRLRGGWTTSLRVTDALLDDIVNEALAELWDVLIAKWADYYTLSTILNATPGQEAIFPAVNWYKFRKLELDESGAAASGDWVLVRPTTLDAMHELRNATRARYRLVRSQILLAPVPTAADRYRLHYIPPVTRLVADGDTFDGINGYESILVQKGKLAVETELKLDTTDTLRRIAELEARVRSAADAPDSDQPFYLDPRGPPGLLEETDEWV